jgi:hypothetical protein
VLKKLLFREAKLILPKEKNIEITNNEQFEFYLKLYGKTNRCMIINIEPLFE